MESVEIRLNEKILADAFTCGFMVFGKMREWPLDHLCWSMYSPTNINLAIFGVTPPSTKDNFALINLEMFQLPADKAEFEKRSAFWSRDRKKWVKLPEGVKFEPKMLALKAVPAAWSDDGFGTSGRNIVHIYTGEKYGLIVRFLLYEGNMLTSPFLRHAMENFRVDEQAWVTTPPVATARALPPAASDAPLGKAVAKEVTGAIKRAQSYLKLKGHEKPLAVQEAILAALEVKIPKQRTEDLAMELGCLWGQVLCDAAQWEWSEVTYAKGEKYYAVVSPDRAAVVAPMHYMLEQIKRAAKKGDVTTMLLFNMIKAGEMGEGRARGYKMLR